MVVILGLYLLYYIFNASDFCTQWAVGHGPSLSIPAHPCMPAASIGINTAPTGLPLINLDGSASSMVKEVFGIFYMSYKSHSNNAIFLESKLIEPEEVNISYSWVQDRKDYFLQEIRSSGNNMTKLTKNDVRNIPIANLHTLLQIKLYSDHSYPFVSKNLLLHAWYGSSEIK